MHSVTQDLSLESYLAALAGFVAKETVRVKADCVLGRELTAAAATAAECPERQTERDVMALKEMIKVQIVLFQFRCSLFGVLAVPGQ